MAAATQLFAVVDAANDARIYPLLQNCEGVRCLFLGNIESPLRENAPYFLPLAENQNFLRAWRIDGRFGYWGIIVSSRGSANDVFRHFRKYLMARLPDGHYSLFRFFDPRVLPGFLMEGDAALRAGWFSVVDDVYFNIDGETYQLNAPTGTIYCRKLQAERT